MKQAFDLATLIFSALFYFCFNWCYFMLVKTSLQMPLLRKSVICGTFLLNFSVFIVCSLLEWNLIINWAVFFLFLLGETLLYCKGHPLEAICFALIGLLCGLVINIFCRCVIAIVINQPLAHFDNHISTVGNLKEIPVSLGFLLGGAVLYWLAMPKSVRRLRVLAEHPHQLSFLLKILTGIAIYLSLNLLIYNAQGNDVLLKLWGVKSCVFVLAGTCLGIRYTLKICALCDYRENNRSIQRELMRKESEEAELRSAAFQDVLTGCQNREAIVETICRLIGEQIPFSLCFTDLDGLKQVNDEQGHSAGDGYLTAMVQELEKTCRKGQDVLGRYGGDEFLVVFRCTAPEAAELRLSQVNERLKTRGQTENFPFPMSFRFGVVGSTQAGDAQKLIALADAKMYSEKRRQPHQPGTTQ